MTSGRVQRQRIRDAKKDYSQPLHIALEDFDFTFTNAEIAQIIALWSAGTTLQGMASKVDREPQEILVLLLDLDYSGKIKLMEGRVT